MPRAPTDAGAIGLRGQAGRGADAESACVRRPARRARPPATGRPRRAADPGSRPSAGARPRAPGTGGGNGSPTQGARPHWGTRPNGRGGNAAARPPPWAPLAGRRYGSVGSLLLQRVRIEGDQECVPPRGGDGHQEPASDDPRARTPHGARRPRTHPSEACPARRNGASVWESSAASARPRQSRACWGKGSAVRSSGICLHIGAPAERLEYSVIPEERARARAYPVRHG